MIGGLSYPFICTKTGIAFATSVLARNLQVPCQRHMILSKWVMRYVAGIPDMKRVFPRSTTNEVPLTTYADADCAGCNDKRRSTAGTFFTINGEAVSWTSRRQTIVALSSSEAEYIAPLTCRKEVTPLRWLF